LPHFALKFDHAGPVVKVLVGVTKSRHEALTKAGQPVPNAVVGHFLVDTGASCTCVDPGLLSQLALTPSGSTTIQTPSTANEPCTVNQFDVSLFLFGATESAFMGIEAMPVVESHLKSQGIDGLLGRDVLGRCLMTYDGVAQVITIAF
jgi:hypothetical protein